jgi:hypothetical protein
MIPDQQQRAGSLGIDTLGLGRIERVPNLRAIWKRETGDLSPWLADNIDVLGEAIGVPMSLVAQHVQVGAFRLDIQAADVEGKPVLVQSQLADSSDDQFGKLLVYASGRNAPTVVWVTTRLREEHRSAITWLNDRTDHDVRLFGVELGLVRIGASVTAPVFDVVAQPNYWTKVAKQAAPSVGTPQNQARTAFFERVFAVMAHEYPTIKAPRLRADGDWVAFASGSFGYYELVFGADASFRVGLSLQLPSKSVFDQLAERKAEIESEVGFKLAWHRCDEIRASRISCYYPDFVDPLHDDPTKLATAAKWGADCVINLHRTLDTELRSLAEELLRK